MSDPFPKKIVRERLDGAIRTLRGEIAGYSLRNEGETRGTVAFEKAPQNFYMGDGDGYSLCKSVCAPGWFRPSPQEIVLGRLTRVIRRLFGVGAVIRVENRGRDGGRTNVRPVHQ